MKYILGINILISFLRIPSFEDDLQFVEIYQAHGILMIF